MRIGLPGALFLIFLVLKLTEVINWSWWYVTMPLWLGLAAVAVAVFSVAILAVIVPNKRKSSIY